MAQQTDATVENNFTKGLITESTGLNFPENAATDTSNCEYTLIGDVLRRQGFDIEENGSSTFGFITLANSSYVWNNVGGDGATKLYVRHDRSTIYFYNISTATVDSPLSNQLLSTSIDINQFVAAGGTLDVTLECQFASGNGYLFVYHPSCDPFYVTYQAGTLTSNRITVQIRDFAGIPVTTPDDYRPPSAGLPGSYLYNLINQGWNQGSPWVATSTTSITVGLGSGTFTVQAGLSATTGQSVVITPNAVSPGTPNLTASGTVLSYSGTTLVINVTSIPPGSAGFVWANWIITPQSIGYINTWQGAVGNNPSNADVWWTFKNASGVFDPATTLNNVTIGSAAPKGHFILSAFSQQRAIAVPASGATAVNTTVRPRTGCWFQGRVWYTGVDATSAAVNEQIYPTTWTESIYFSQVIQNPLQFGKCYQQNDPTSETLFGLLPTDGGVITIPGIGSIYKLFPLHNGLLVFGANGNKFITGSQGLGFSANDYTIIDISDVKSISSTSFVNVNGLPYFWNEEGIYKVEPIKNSSATTLAKQFEVTPITVGTILSFYNSIPVSSKKFVRGDYHPIDYVIQWTYRSTPETGVADRYNFDTILNYNTYNNAFYPYTLGHTTGDAVAGNPFITGVNYISYPQTSSLSPEPGFKYPLKFLASGTVGAISFADEHDSGYIDWRFAGGGINYESYFITGYKLKGQAIKKFQPQYIQVYSRMDGSTVGYKIQGIWNYAISGNSGKFTNQQQVMISGSPNYGTVFKRHKIRGNGFALQFKITSNDGIPFDIQGWAVVDTINQGT